MNSRKNQQGFSAIEAILILVIIGLIGGIGWYVLNAKKTTDKTLDTSSQSAAPTQVKKTTVKLAKTYTDTFGNFSVNYPANWKLATKPTTDYGSSATLTSPQGTILNVYANMGGKGGDCPPADGDVPFHAGNMCPSSEYLSSEKLPIHNIYYAKEHKQNDALGSIDFTYEPAEVVMVTTHYADPDGKAQYVIGATQSTETSPVKLHNPFMGLVTTEEWITHYDKAGTFKPYIYTYAVGDSEAFLSSKDATTIKAILRTLKVKD